MENKVPAKVLVTNSATFEADIAKGVCLVDFWAEWCGPCKMMLPLLDQVAEAVGDKAKVYKMNVDENLQTAQSFRIMSIPCMIVFKDGKEVERFVGVQDPKELEKVLKSI